MEDYRKIKGLKTLPEFRKIIKKITISPLEGNKEILSENEKVFILSCALVLLRYYDIDKRYKSYAELAYYLILKYSLITSDYQPLYDFSVNFGFYPISKALIEDEKIQTNDIINDSISYQIENNFRSKDIIETYEQKKIRELILEDESNEVCFIAPTSFGKSSLIIDDIEKNFLLRNYVGIIVPSKSLLAQTYKEVKKKNFKIKIIIHDEMYENETKFIAILTQERALRLLNKNNELYFDALYIDEAHNIFNKDYRNILLSRLININRLRNERQKVIYLSPLISDSDNLKLSINQDISEQKIDFNMKELEIYELCLSLECQKYNRFLDEFYYLKSYKNYIEYFLTNEGKKNFIYLYSPKKIEKFSEELYRSLQSSDNGINNEIKNIIDNLKKYVHEDFYEIEYLKKGIIYLHGKIPDNIKEYLEYKFKTISSIKYLIANKVILEGINLPIDCLFILSTYNITAKDLTNLIGRVNRLNMIFNKGKNNYKYLLPNIHFINTKEYNRTNSNMSGSIRKLRTGIFKDDILNPMLLEFDLEQYDITKESDLRKYNDAVKIQENESFVISSFDDSLNSLKKKMIENGLNTIYELSNSLIENLYKIILRKQEEESVLDNSNGVMQLIYEIFIQNFEEYIINEEFRRLKNDKAINYYTNFLDISRSKSLKENIENICQYFHKKKQNGDSKLYIGESFGEIPYEYRDGYSKNVYVDLKDKDHKQIVNLAIIKFKLESDFVNYTLIKFFQIMMDYNIISKKCYNEIVYGTNEERKLNLLKIGLTINVINKLEVDKQLDNIFIDENNLVYGNEKYLEYKNSIDDFFNFELDKFINID